MSASGNRLLFRIEATLSAITGVMAIVTIFWRDWIEGLTGWDPDHHNGTAEVYIILGLAVVSVVLGLVARRSWRRLRPAPAAT